MNLPVWIEAIGSAGILIAGCGYAWGQFKQGKNQQSMDNDSIYKGRIEALELKARTQDDDIVKLTKEVHDLKLVIEEKDKKLSDALAILQDKNPAMVDFIKSGMEYIVTATPIIAKMDKFLDKQVL